MGTAGLDGLKQHNFIGSFTKQLQNYGDRAFIDPDDRSFDHRVYAVADRERNGADHLQQFIVSFKISRRLILKMDKESCKTGVIELPEFT